MNISAWQGLQLSIFNYKTSFKPLSEPPNYENAHMQVYPFPLQGSYLIPSAPFFFLIRHVSYYCLTKMNKIFD